jgi:hypothetical protein
MCVGRCRRRSRSIPASSLDQRTLNHTHTDVNPSPALGTRTYRKVCYKFALHYYVYMPYNQYVSRDSSVGIATPYGLDGRWIQTRRGRGFRHPSGPAQVPTQPPVQWVSDLFPGGKEAGAWRWPPSRSGVKERVELYLYSPSVSS